MTSGTDPQANVRPGMRRVFSPWMALLPFLLSAMLHLSGVFAIFSPFPLLLLIPSFPFWGLIAALAVNALWVALLLNPLSSLLFLAFCAPVVLLARELLVRRGYDFKRAVFTGFGVHLAILSLLLLIYGFWVARGGNPFTLLETEINAWVGRLMEVSKDAIREADLTPEQVRNTVWTQMPSMVLSALFIGVFGNFLLFVKIVPLPVPARRDPAPYKTWKNPDWLIVPTLASGFAMLFLEAWPGIAGSNFFRFFAVLYGIQGIGVMSALLDRFRIFGFFRSMLYLGTLLFLFPLVVGVGFFDLWFDFRSKFRQS